jgi:hypothetical protein
MTAPAQPAPAKASAWEDFIDIFYAPSSVFERRTEANVWMPFIFITIVLAVVTFLNRGLLEVLTDIAVTKGMEAAQKANPQLTADQVASAKALQLKIAPYIAMIGAPLRILFVGILIWIAGLVAGARMTFGTSMLVATFSSFPRVLEQVSWGIQWLALSPDAFTSLYSTNIGPARFLDPNGNQLVLGVLSRFDIFTIWCTVIIGIGVAVKAKTTAARATIVAVAVWIIGALPVLIGAARSQ